MTMMNQSAWKSNKDISYYIIPVSFTERGGDIHCLNSRKKRQLQALPSKKCCIYLILIIEKYY